MTCVASSSETYQSPIVTLRVCLCRSRCVLAFEGIQLKFSFIAACSSFEMPSPSSRYTLDGFCVGSAQNVMLFRDAVICLLPQGCLAPTFSSCSKMTSTFSDDERQTRSAQQRVWDFGVLNLSANISADTRLWFPPLLSRTTSARRGRNNNMFGMLRS